MKHIKTIINSGLYIPFIALLSLPFFSLYHIITTVTDQVERNVGIWTAVLNLITAFGFLGNFFVLDRFSKLATGRVINIVFDLVKGDSGDNSVSYNGLVGSTLYMTVSGVLLALFLKTQNNLFLVVAKIIIVFSFLGTTGSFTAVYFRVRNNRSENNYSKMANLILLPFIINLVALLGINQNTVRFVYEIVLDPNNLIFLILVLIVLLCYVLAVMYCFFSVLYCLIAFNYVKKDSNQMQARVDELQSKEQKREGDLRHIAAYVDEKAIQVCFVKRIGLAFLFFHSHIKAYYQEKVYAISYLLLFWKKKNTMVFSRLLEEEQIKANIARFCAIALMVELLTLDMALFIFLGSDNACSRFFELLSTVVIIPILLSWLADLKAGKRPDG